MPLPGTRVIHKQFSTHHRATAEGTMRARCRINRPATTPGVPTFDVASGRSVYPDPPLVHTGPCRVQRAPRAEEQVDSGDREVTIQRYMVGIPAAAPVVQIGDRVTVTECDDDPQLIGQRMTVRAVHLASLLWERDLLCDLQPTHTR